MMNVFILYLSNNKYSIIAAWRRIKGNDGSTQRESNNDDIHLYCMYIFTYSQRH